MAKHTTAKSGPIAALRKAVAGRRARNSPTHSHRLRHLADRAYTLLSERFGAYVTGASIVVDGGIALHNWIEPTPPDHRP